MGRIPRFIVPGTAAHIYTRGNHRQDIFLEPTDWEWFLERLRVVKRLRPFRLYAYALMSNHLHLLMEAMATPISDIMQMLLLSYAKRLNARLERTGHVFQSRFKRILVTKDSYLQQLVRYIHLNPVRAGMAADPSAWPYTGHLEYLGESPRGLIDQELVLSMFHPDPQLARQEYRKFVNDGLSAAGPVPTEWVAPPVAPGPPVRDILSLRPSLSDLPLPSDLMGGVTLAAIRSGSRIRAVVAARNEFILCTFRMGYSVTEIADYLSFTRSAVSKALRHLVA